MIWILIILGLINLILIIKLLIQVINLEREYIIHINKVTEELSNHINIIYNLADENYSIIKKEYNKKLEDIKEGINKIPREVTIKNVLSI